MSEYTAYLRGINFRPEEARRIAKTLVEDQILTLMREPGNPHDENAIQVIEPNTQMFIGYVAKEVAADLAPELDEGKDYTCFVEANMAGSILLNIVTNPGQTLQSDDLTEEEPL